ncbi:restriction endonuclease subunit S [Tenacibaculum maritimum]|uniref:restriction endonuclease subunit S n=1 Tax=Tenacibaculum maritimum TaxID=107401 RepID=UPI001E34A4C5|nr:restriction endonuclease subunit S [Tenacibaculum maritimum]MCD9585612.1 restriction endonuclease subunit S [Tenacibaculum maritimum]
MELTTKQGFKQTEVGLIPEDWRVRELDHVLKFGSGQDYKHLSKGEIPVYGTGGIMTYVNNHLYNGESVGIGRKGTIDKPVFLSGKFWTVDTLFYTKDFLDSIPKFIYYKFLIIPWKEYNEASGVPSLNKNTLGKIKIALPPTLKEQKAIATALSDMDDLIASLEDLIAKKQAIKQGAMRQLLTGKKRIKGFEKNNKYINSEYGNIPSDWKITSLGSVTNIFGRIGFRGYTVKDLVEEGHGALSLSPSNIIENKIDFTKKTFISWFKYEESPEIKVQSGDIVLVKTASIGKTALIKEMPFKITLNPQVVVFKNFKMDNILLSYIIKNPIIQSQIKSFVVGGVVPTLSQEQIKSFSFPCPKSIKEQQSIAKILSDMDAELEQLETKKAKYQQLKQGMLQELLTGNTRLV